MKLTEIFLAVSSVFFLASCSDDDGKDPVIDPATLQDASITIAVSGMDNLSTKTDRPTTDYGNNPEKNIKDYAVIYAIGDEVVGYGYRERGGYIDTTACVGLKAAKEGTEYKMLVIANAGQGLIKKKDGTVVSFTAEAPSFSWKFYEELLVDLEDQTKQSLSEDGVFVMTSLPKTIKVVPGFNYIGAPGDFPTRNGEGHLVPSYEPEAGDYANSKVYVHRLAARVELYTLGVDWKDEDLASYKGMYFQLDSIFMANVRANSLIGTGDVLENKDAGYLYGGGNNLKEGTDTDIALNSISAKYLGKALRYGVKMDEQFVIRQGETVEISGKYGETGKDSDKDSDKNDYSRENGFYVMENSSSASSGEHPTTLYLKGSWYDVNNNLILPDRYYRIQLENAVTRNKIYRIGATLTGKGSPQPGDNKDNLDIEVKITLEDWIVKSLGNINVNPTPVK